MGFIKKFLYSKNLYPMTNSENIENEKIKNCNEFKWENEFVIELIKLKNSPEYFESFKNA